MFAKKKALFVPPGDAYADDPTAYSSRRNLPYSTLSRNHRVRSLRGGDPKNSMPRQFDGWFLEKERVVDVEEGMKWKDIIVRRIKFYIVAVLSSSLYDYVYVRERRDESDVSRAHCSFMTKSGLPRADRNKRTNALRAG